MVGAIITHLRAADGHYWAATVTAILELGIYLQLRVVTTSVIIRLDKAARLIFRTWCLRLRLILAPAANRYAVKRIELVMWFISKLLRMG